jgi:cytochrome c-type biogenesis protein CcsB
MITALPKATLLFYFLATVGFITYLAFSRTLVARLSPLALLAGFLLHTAAFAVHFADVGYVGVAQFREALSFYSWLMVGVYLVALLKYNLTVLGSFVAPLALLLALASFAMDAGAGELPPALKSYWLPLHVIFAFLGNAIFAMAFGLSVMYLLQEHQLKHKRMTVLTERLPSLETLDRLNYVFLSWGFPFMTLGILTGSLWARAHWGDYWSWEPRQISSTLTWLLYGALLQARITAGIRGRKAAIVTMVGFAFVLGYFLWGSAVFSTRHGGMFE